MRTDPLSCLGALHYIIPIASKQLANELETQPVERPMFRAYGHVFAARDEKPSSVVSAENPFRFIVHLFKRMY